MLANHQNFINLVDLYEQVKQQVTQDLIVEVSAQAPRELRRMERIVDPLCSDPMNLSDNELGNIALQLSDSIRNFGGFEEVEIEFHEDLFNFFVYPFYYAEKPAEPRDDIDPMVKGMHIIIGLKMIKDLNMTPQEFVAVILHEIGHIHYHKNAAPRILTNLFRNIGQRGVAAGTFSTLFGMFQYAAGNLVTVPIIGPIILVTFLTITRTNSIFEHKEEYGADRFAVQHGYGDEIKNFVAKLGNVSYQDNRRSLIRRAMDFVKNIMNIGTHPQSKNRVCNIAKSMLNEHARMYPELRNAVQKQINNLNC